MTSDYQKFSSPVWIVYHIAFLMLEGLKFRLFNKLKIISDKSFSHKFLPINGNSNYSRMMFPYFDTVDNLNSHSIVWVRVPSWREIWNCILDGHISHRQFYSNEFSITVYDYTGAFEFYVLFSVFCFLCFVLVLFPYLFVSYFPLCVVCSSSCEIPICW